MRVSRQGAGVTEVSAANVVVVGSVNLDVVVHADHLPAPGETVLGGDMRRLPGGKGANQAVAAARVGARAVLFAATGDDPFAAEVRAALRAEGVDLAHVDTVEGVPTGVAMVVVGRGGENAITVAPGANSCLVARADAISAALGPSDVLVLQLEVPLETCLVAARAAQLSGARVVLNAAPPPVDRATTFERLLDDVDVLVVNETEALSIDPRRIPDDLSEWKTLALELNALGPSASIITLGGDGAAFAVDGLAYYQPAFATTVVDSTGAGDAFCGALATRLAQGRSFADAVRVGCAAGALATRSLGPQAALPTALELEDFLAQAGVHERTGGAH